MLVFVAFLIRVNFKILNKKLNAHCNEASYFIYKSTHISSDPQQQTEQQQQNPWHRDQHAKQRYTIQLRQPHGRRDGADTRAPSSVRTLSPTRAPSPMRPAAARRPRPRLAGCTEQPRQPLRLPPGRPLRTSRPFRPRERPPGRPPRTDLAVTGDSLGNPFSIKPFIAIN